MSKPKSRPLAQNSIIRVQSPRGTVSQLFITASRQLHETLRPHLEAACEERASSGGFLADVIPWYRIGSTALVGPVLGSAAMHLSLRPFLENGCDKVTFLGFSGGLDADKAVADLLFPLAVRVEENCVLPLKQQEPELTAVVPPGSRTWFGTIAATAHPYQMNAAVVQQWKQEGCSFVEMELAALAELQEEFSFQLRAFCIVSDFIDAQGRQTSGLQSKALKRMCERLSARIAASSGLEKRSNA